MPRFRAKPSKKARPSSISSRKKQGKVKTKENTSDDRAERSPQHAIDSDRLIDSKGKQREVVDTVHLAARADPSDTPFLPGLMVPSSIASVSSATSTPTTTTSPTSTAVTNPIATLHHNTPLILCIVVGAVVVIATLSVGLAWVLRLACCAGDRRARRKRKLDRATWSPSADVSKDHTDKAEERNSFDSVTVTADDDVNAKDVKIDLLFSDTAKDGAQVTRDVPVLGYADNGKAPRSTWNGKGWTLFDPPVAAIQPPEPAATSTPTAAVRGGNYGAARQELADRDVGGFTWPASVQRQPSFIERLVQRHHQASDLPTAAPSLPYPFQAKPPQPASRMASLGGAANRAVLNMLPVTLRNAATTASRQRATRKRYNDMQPYLDSDFEGTIGGKDRELPMARRLRRAEERMAVDWTTEEEGDASALEDNGKLPLHNNAHTFPRVQPVFVPTPVLNPQGKAAVEFTPGLAGVGAAWSRRGSQQPLLPASDAAGVVGRASMATERLPKVIGPNRASLLPFPELEGDRRTRLLGSVGRWLGHVTEAGETADPYTALSPRPDRRITKNGSLRSDYTSTTLADSTASNSETHIDARTSTSGAGKSERLLERVDADQAEHDRQQRRLLRKARLFAPTSVPVDLEAQQATAVKSDSDSPAGVNVSRAPSIRPQFCATTDLKSWLEPGKVSTTHGFKVLEAHEAASSVGVDPFASDADCGKTKPLPFDVRPVKPKLRSSSSKQQLRSSTKDASRQKREMARSTNTGLAKKASHDALASGCQSSAAITVVSSVFDEAFAAQLTKSSAAKKAARSSERDDDAKFKAKAEADAAMREAWRRRRMLSLSSRGSQRSRTKRTTRTQSDSASALLSRQESLLSQPSVYSELTAPSDYAFRAPLFSDTARSAMLTSCGASTVDDVPEEADADQERQLNAKTDAMRKKEEEEEVQIKKQLKKQAKKEAKREQRRAERQKAKQAAAAATAASRPVVEPPSLGWHRSVPANLSTTNGDAEAVRRVIRKQRSVSLGAARSQFAMISADDDHATATAPDSPWTSSDSDISIRRWGEPRRDDSVRLHTRGARHHHSNSTPAGLTDAAANSNRRMQSNQARSNSYYFGMGAGSDLRDLR
ncbi:hypothetical protein EX895_001090 [Sporisorium graminicola]|uniref:Uncharacterized protein n=1 Tax=Sporisorium graminicola TaxID=280036 RepID=A0A4U7KYH4_9BASI|nr:hypothetical protein EX895_001090 [Sporisorium graminicola]TKY89793.1 hypothetical protein EX895_001090 [Sporisorium graminicola]